MVNLNKAGGLRLPFGVQVDVVASLAQSYLGGRDIISSAFQSQQTSSHGHMHKASPIALSLPHCLPLMAILERLTLLVFVKCFGFRAYLSTSVTVPTGLADNMPAHYLDMPQKQTYPLC
ncbi:hypothetical protein D8674_008553 [Pyrus ussuriensis x Pyrus communis]|uniref:Uncharacterized protein n=1 Tax=Pyrus ussuriensis x Pyrus communis TaxID=2448454 RepID=A0A5N5I601_9ROSA|nr:hypothetical protein D8674_008553 [Pyrus ussuriensis x Pyrus communis]